MFLVKNCLIILIFLFVLIFTYISCTSRILSSLILTNKVHSTRVDHYIIRLLLSGIAALSWDFLVHISWPGFNSHLLERRGGSVFQHGSPCCSLDKGGCPLEECHCPYEKYWTRLDVLFKRQTSLLNLIVLYIAYSLAFPCSHTMAFLSGNLFWIFIFCYVFSLPQKRVLFLTNDYFYTDISGTPFRWVSLYFGGAWLLFGEGGIDYWLMNVPLALEGDILLHF